MTEAQKPLVTLNYLKSAMNVQKILSRVLSWILIPCTVFVFIFLVAPSEAKAFVQTTQTSSMPNGTLIALQASESTTVAVRTFAQAASALDPDGTLIVDVSPAEHDGMVLVTVANDWQYQPYQMRKQAAQGLWKMWAATYSPEKPDSARVKILDLSGNRVGGSSAFAGSLVDVDK